MRAEETKSMRCDDELFSCVTHRQLRTKSMISLELNPKKKADSAHGGDSSPNDVDLGFVSPTLDFVLMFGEANMSTSGITDDHFTMSNNVLHRAE
ncbi:uncharacterized protein V6R79_004885 [Siganus canaliculatus]